MTLTRTTARRSLLVAAAVGLLTGAPSASAAELPVELPVELPGELPVELPGGVPPLPGLPDTPALPGTGGIPTGELPGVLPGAPTGAGSGAGGTGSGAGGGGGEPGPTSGLPDTGALDPVISGPSRAVTVRVDSRGRFRVAGVSVTCPVLSPASCGVAVRVATAGGPRVKFVSRDFGVKPGTSLELAKLKLSKKGQRALRGMRAARVVVAVTASRPGGVPRAREIRLKLKPAKR
jgi:hypothetical protein